MPFDSTGFVRQTESSPVRLLIEARALLADPARWCKHTMNEGTRMCMVGAIVSARRNFGQKTHNTAMQTLVAATHSISIPDFNDSACTTHEDVLGAFDDAIAMLRAKQM